MKRFRLTCALMLIAASACRGSDVNVVGTPVTEAPHVDKPQIHVALLGAIRGGSMFSAQHALAGAQLAFDLANEEGSLPVEIVAVEADTSEDPSVVAEEVSDLAGDQSNVGIVAWPSSAEAPALASGAAAADLPVLSVSPAGGTGGAEGFWSRMVASDRALARSSAHLVAASAGRRPVCVTGDDGSRASDLTRWVLADLASRHVDVGLTSAVAPQRSDYLSLVRSLADARCGVVFWSGGTTEGGLIRSEMSEVGLSRALMVGIDTLVADPFATTALEAGDGTIAACPCVDVSTSTSLAAQRFIQGYQSKYGSPPSVFSVEGWDAAQRYIEAIAAGDLDRASIGRFLAEQSGFEGLGGSYVFDPQGDSMNSEVYLYEEGQGAWTLLGRSGSVIKQLR